MNDTIVISFERIRQPPKAVTFGCGGGRDRSQFDEMCMALGAEWYARRAVPDGVQSQQLWLASAVYAVLVTAPKGLKRMCLSRLQQMPYDARGAKPKHDTFADLLIKAVFAHDQQAITAQQRWIVSRRVWLAYRHYVPSALLAGFWAQIPTSQLVRRSTSASIEPGFEGQIIAGRLPKSPFKDFRGSYPEHIEKAVKGLRRHLRRIEKLEGDRDWGVNEEINGLVAKASSDTTLRLALAISGMAAAS